VGQPTKFSNNGVIPKSRAFTSGTRDLACSSTAPIRKAKASDKNVRATWFVSLLRRGVVVVADHACDLPGSVFVLPQMNELAFANSDGVFVTGMVKAVNPDFERAISLHVIDLQRPGNEFARG